MGVRADRGVLFLDFRYRGLRCREYSGFPDTPENRVQLQNFLNLVTAEIANGIFDYRHRFPNGSRLASFYPAQPDPPRPVVETVRSYYSRWIKTKMPPLVRKSQARDYRQSMERYVLPAIGDLELTQVTGRVIVDLRQRLLTEPGIRGRPLGLKSVRNILDGNLRAMLRDARKLDGLIELDPFASVDWPRRTVPPPDPFTEEERDAILDWFRRRSFTFNSKPSVRRPHPHFHAYAHLLFWTGMRPSEGAALLWSDIDLDAGVAFVRRSFHLGEMAPTKTEAANRVVELPAATVSLLRQIEPLRHGPDAPVFVDTKGNQLDPNDSFAAHWHEALRALNIRPRGKYSTKDTYCSLALTAGVDIKRLEQQTGVAAQTLLRHYAGSIRPRGQVSIDRMIDEARAVRSRRMRAASAESWAETWAESDADEQFPLENQATPTGFEPVLPA